MWWYFKIMAVPKVDIPLGLNEPNFNQKESSSGV
jgi:hypothetical protein